jgi:hypothetical protein
MPDAVCFSMREAQPQANSESDIFGKAEQLIVEDGERSYWTNS